MNVVGMAQIKLIVVACLFCWSMTGCFDIVEEVDLKSDGSGAIKATLNLSKSRTKAASLMKLDKIEGIKVPSQSEIRREMNTVVSLLEQTPGISNVRYTLDFSDFIASISCDFKDVRALNTFAQTLSKHLESNVSGYSSYTYDKSSKTFSRTYTHSTEAKKHFDKLSTESKRSFNDAFYTSIYRFQATIKSSSNRSAKISPNKKAVMLKFAVPELVHGKASLSNNITIF